jgi:hypothetical protein
MNDIQHSEISEFPGLEFVALMFNVYFPDLAGGKSDMEGSALRINALDRRNGGVLILGAFWYLIY